MFLNTKILVITAFAGVVGISVAASLPQQQEPPQLKNLKVFPKNIPFRVLDHTMDTWAESLGVRCNFCHALNPETKKMDFASDAKPEKQVARHMYLMTAKINKKFFKAEKDSLGMMMESSVNCYTCHRGSAHPEVTLPERHHGPGGPPAGATGPGGTPPSPPAGQ